MILLTTSRRPTRRIRTLCHDLARSIPNVVRINRGKLNLDGIAERALELKADRVIVVDRWKGGPGKINLFRVEAAGLTSVHPLMYVAGIRLQREIEAEAKAVRSLVVTTAPKNSPEVTKIAENLSNFLNFPLSSIDEAASKYQASMHVSHNASGRIQITFMLLPQMVETGPRIIISRVVWEN
ncbi:MAG: putative Brix domain-containing ribosomal biogenesis protein [Candidatus Bathyarchaeota archaeon BA2]|nr:MAG: putative Brix domain-containing ribosomal biogenesis protein [Candidatus Bathyarchaeota archaeon BA2]